MALFQVGASPLDIQLLKRDGRVFRIAIEGELTIQRGPNEASRLSCTVLRNSASGDVAMTAENGEIISVVLDGGHEMFFGYIMNTRKQNQYVTISAVDQMGYMARNIGVHPYGDIKFSELFKQLCLDYKYNISLSDVVDTEYTIPNVVLDGDYHLDFLLKNLEITEQNTGRRFYIRDAFDKLCLQDEGIMAVTTFQITQQSIESYEYIESIESMVNSVTVQTNNEDIGQREMTQLNNDTAMNYWGTFSEIKTIKPEENADEVARNLLTDKCKVDVSLTVSGAQGEPRVWGGSPVFVDLFSDVSSTQREFIRGWFRCDSVTHKISNATHTMDLKLSLIEMYDNWEDFGVGK